VIPAACRAFDAWLDQGMPGDTAPAHVSSCGRCARALEAALALERALAEPMVAPPGFTDAVMARIASGSPALAGTTDMPWWLRAAAQPATALALMLAAVVMAGRGMIASWALAGQVALAEALARGVPGSLLGPLGGLALPTFQDPAVRFGLALGLVPLVTLASLALHGWTVRSLTPALRAR
jgi:hypothetical protein